MGQGKTLKFTYFESNCSDKFSPISSSCRYKLL